MHLVDPLYARCARWRGPAAAVLVVASLAVSVAHASSLEPIRGVAPEQQSAFQNLECLVGGIKTALPLERVNDDYCDCDGGEDEPGTSACSHLYTSEFHCENDGYFQRKIHTSRVNDGICDCCDGSDEYLIGACGNTCVAEAAQYREESQARLADVERGYAQRQQVIDHDIAAFFAEVDEAQSSTAQLLASLTALKERVETHKAREELLEVKLRVELARQKQSEGQHIKGDQPTSNEERQGDGCVVDKENGQMCGGEGGDANTAGEFEEVDAADVLLADSADRTAADIEADQQASDLLDTIGSRVTSMIDLPDGTRVTLAEYFRMDRVEHPPKRSRPRTAEQRRREDFLGPLFNGGTEERKRVGIYALRTLGIVLSPVRGVVEAVIFAPNLLWGALSELGAFNSLPSLPAPTRSVWFRGLAGGQVYQAYTSSVWGARIVWDAPVFVYRYLFPELDDGVTLPVASSLRKIVAEIEGDIAKLEKDRDAKLEAAKADYGPDRAYFAIKDKCIEKKIEKYKYKFCPFNEVKQSNTRLGRWETWGTDESGKPDYGKMMFTKGLKCWNGPDRSVAVVLECGAEDEIVGVAEPSTCIYEMTVQTPLACSSQVLAQAREAAAFWQTKQ